MSQKWRKLYQNEVDEEIRGVDSRDKVKYNERSDRLCCQKRQQCRSNVRLGSIRQCCFDVVAGVDGA